jgi:hypothetical protein
LDARPLIFRHLRDKSVLLEQLRLHRSAAEAENPGGVLQVKGRVAGGIQLLRSATVLLGYTVMLLVVNALALVIL